MAYIGNSPANVGNYAVVDDIASSFNGTTTSFALTSLSQAINPAKSGQLLVSVNGVLQEPDDTGADGFKVSGSNIVFSSAPASGSTFWCVYQGANVDIGTPSAGTVGTAQMSYPLGNFSSTGIDDNATSTAITIDASENVGIKCTPSPWNTSAPVSGFQFGRNGITALFDYDDESGNSQSILMNNMYYASSGYKFVSSTADYSSHYQQVDGQHNFITSTSSGTTGQAVTTKEVFRLGQGGDAIINNGNLVIGTSGKGIDFSAVSDGTRSVSSNVLDDYEEGEFTPVISNGTVSYSTQLGKYTKIGNIVTAFIDISISSWSGGSTVPNISLPFTAKSGWYGSVTPWTVSSVFTGTGSQLTGYTAGAGINLYKTIGASNQYASGMNNNVVGRIAMTVIYAAS